jgi:hypothetical protein
MDATTQAFVTEIVSRKIAENWLYWLLFLASSFLAAFAGAYIKRRAENLATREDFNELKRQLQQTTRLTEEIKAEIGHAEWKQREVNTIMRAKLEELVRHISVLDEAVRGYVKTVSAGKDQRVSTTEIDTLKAIVSLYFPTLDEPAFGYTQSCRDMIIWAMSRRDALRKANEEARLPEYTRALATETIGQAAIHLASNFDQKTKLEAAASTLMQELLAVH